MRPYAPQRVKKKKIDEYSKINVDKTLMRIFCFLAPSTKKEWNTHESAVYLQDRLEL